MRPWTVQSRKALPDRGMASMGPRPCGRGRTDTTPGLTTDQCFNGATALRPWTASSACSSLARRHCFNGATALRPWTAGRRRGRARQGLASMGPRPCGRGRRGRQRASSFGFRASMGPRPCGRGRRYDGAVKHCRYKRFNGATALRPWTAMTRAGSERSWHLLQWGHGLAAVDGKSAAPSHSSPTASMGPRPCGRGREDPDMTYDAPPALQWGHGLAAVDGPAGFTNPRRPSGFNGATALRPWTAAWRGNARNNVHSFNGATALRPWTGGRRLG